MTAACSGPRRRRSRSTWRWCFHRFLDGEAYDGRARLELTLNGDAGRRVGSVRPRRAAHAEPSSTGALVRGLRRSDDLHRRPAVRPPGQHLFSSPEAHRRAGGPRRWNRHQGLYIYRRDRLIQAGGWNRLRTLDEHAKLARISVDLPLGRRGAIRRRRREDARVASRGAPRRCSGPWPRRPCRVAQERYRDHLDASAPELDTADLHRDPEAISISRDWPAILAVVDDVLGHDLSLRDRLLLRLANADPEDVASLERR